MWDRSIDISDPQVFQAYEVETLLGVPRKHMRAGWKAKTTFKQLVSEMVREDLQIAQKDELCKQNGYEICAYNE